MRKADKYKIPIIFLSVYISIIFIFAGVYTIYGDEFYHTTVQYEATTNSEYNKIKAEIQNNIRNTIESTYNHDSVYLDNNQYWILNNKDLYVTSFNTQDGQFIISILVYITNGHNPINSNQVTGFIQESKTFDLKFSGISSFDSKHETQSFYFNIKNEKNYIKHNEINDYDLNKIFNKDGVSEIKLIFPYKFSKELNAYTKSLYGFPNEINGKFIRMLYLSMVTITTLGYGDIVPLTNLTRILVGLEAIIGIVVIGWFASTLLIALKKEDSISQRTKKMRRFISFKKQFKYIKDKLKCVRSLVYSIIALLGLSILGLSFLFKDNYSSVLCGVGTGLFTSLVVSISINYENDLRLKRKIEEDKHYVLNNIVYASKDVYIDIIYRINEYILYQDNSFRSIYQVYNEFKPVVELCKKVSAIDLNNTTDVHRKQLEKLFNIRSYRIDFLVSELKRLPKTEYYLSGLLTKDECESLSSNSANDLYLEYTKHIKEFWDDEIIDLGKCVTFLKMTLYICAKVIDSLEFCKNTVAQQEKAIKDEIDERYYNEIYSNTEEYIEKQLEAAQAQAEYYDTHPEELELLEKQFEELENETQEDRLIKDLYCCICGLSMYSLNDLLNKADANSLNMLKFIMQDEIQKSLKKSFSKRKAIKKKFGSTKIIKEKLNNINKK